MIIDAGDTPPCESHLEIVTDHPEKEIADFRWKLGHHITAACFAFALRDAKMIQQGRGDTEELAENICKHLSAVNALFQYTASMSGDLYRNSLRFQMQQQHPAFSANWWKEARAVRKELMGLKKDHPGIRDALKTFWQMHGRVPAKMGVGDSLRKMETDKAKATPPANPADAVFDERKAAIFDPYFDNFFMIQRTEDGEAGLYEQLVARQTLMIRDILQNGLEKDDHFMGLSAHELLAVVDEAVQAAARTPANGAIHIELDHVGYHVPDVKGSREWLIEMFRANKHCEANPPYSPVVAETEPGLGTVTEYPIGGAAGFNVHLFDVTNQAPEDVTPHVQHLGIRVKGAEELSQLHAQWQRALDTFRPQYDALKELMGLSEEQLCTSIGVRDSGNKGVFYCFDPTGLRYEILYERPKARP